MDEKNNGFHIKDIKLKNMNIKMPDFYKLHVKKVATMKGIRIVEIGMALLTIVTMASTGNVLGILMNLFFLSVMAYLIHRAQRRAIDRMAQTGEDCQRIEAWLKEQKEADLDGEILWDYIKECKESNQLFFVDEKNNERWNRYLDGRMSADIDDYLDEDEILECYEKNYCDLIPGVLTALGILGTFLGLIFSISSFKLDNPDALEMALSNIVGGMNVAFYTSVYGVTLSIMFNLIYKNYQKKFVLKLRNLKSTVQYCFEASVSGEWNEQLVSYSKNQQEELERIKDILEADMAGQIGGQIAETMKPAFDKIDKSLNRVIGDFRKEQSASLQNVVEAFVEQMSTALDAHINHLGDSVERLSGSQTEMSKDMRKLLEEIGKTADDTRSVNNESALILKKFEEYMNSVNAMLEVANRTFVSVETYSREMYNMAIIQENVVKDIAKHERELKKAYQNIMNMYSQMKELTHMNMQMTGKWFDEQTEMIQQQRKLSESMDKYVSGTITIFTEMKSAQLAAASKYQENWQMLSKISEDMTEYVKALKSDKKGTYVKSVENSQTTMQFENREMMELMEAQTRALFHIQEYMRQQEERNENKLFRRITRKMRKKEQVR